MAVTYAEGRIKMTADDDLTQYDHFLIKSITWAFVAAGQNLILTDQDNKDIWRADAEAKNLEMHKEFDPPLQVQQIKVENLSLGDLQKPNISRVLIYI